MEDDTKLICVLSDIRLWRFCPIQMPVNANREGPAAIGVDAVAVLYEVWDECFTSYGSFDNLPDAINHAMFLETEWRKKDEAEGNP